MKTYHGIRTKNGCIVKVSDDKGRRHLRLRLDLCNHSPTGFEWGYGGSGPSQLALAILADCLGDSAAVVLHQDFKFNVIAGLRGDGWEMSQQKVEAGAAEAIRFLTAQSTGEEVPSVRCFLCEAATAVTVSRVPCAPLGFLPLCRDCAKPAKGAEVFAKYSAQHPGRTDAFKLAQEEDN